MTVFVAHGPADRQVAEALEKFLERRGQFVELDDGQTALRPIQQSDVLVLLISKDLVFAPMRLRLEQRALDAWAEGKLIVVKLDKGIAPVGLRDLPALDASFEAQREFKWQELANLIREKLRAPPPAGASGEAAPQSPTQRAGRKGRGLWGALLLVLLTLPGLVALAATVAIWLANRIGAVPGGLQELRAGVDALGMRYGAPTGVTEWVFAVAIVVTLVCVMLLLERLFSRAARAAPIKQRKEEAPQTEGGASPTTQSGAHFVSYARANQKVVLPVIEAAQRAGRRFWLDQQGLSAGDGWAGEIVKAMREAGGVVIMCSKAAFESDHVKREVYLADRYRKRMLPVFIEDAQPPEDFEYFFAGVQTLDLAKTPDAERPQALLQALGT
jgi:hypothetical protein